MKKLFSILLFVPLALFGQSFLSIQQDSPLELSSGWNMIGYSCYEPMNVTEAFSLIEDKVLIVKNNNGDAYIPEWSFNGIGDLIRNKGYQLKLTQAISDFQFCPFIVPLVYGCTDETAFNYNPNSNTDNGSCYPFVYGCLDNLYVEYNELANTDDGSCETLIVWGCIDESALNFNEEANTDDGSCMYPIGGIEFQLNDGWNMVAFTGCEITPIDEAFQGALLNGSSLEETFDIIKDVRGRMWHPALGDNSPLTHLIPGEGYMMKVNPGSATTLSFSEDYCNDITYWLSSGWNMVGFTGDVDADNNFVSSIDNALGNGADTYSTFQVIKNVAGQFWSPFFSQLTTLNPGEAYMMYVTSGQQTTLSFTDNSTQVFAYNYNFSPTLFTPYPIIPVTTDNNMSVVFPAGTLSNFAGAEITAQTVKYTYAGPADAILGIPPIDSTVTPTSETIIINEDGSAGIPVMGSDNFCNCSDVQAENNDLIRFVIYTEEGSITVNTDIELNYASNSFSVMDEWGSIYFSIDGVPVVFGCDDDAYTEYSPDVNWNDGSCATYAIWGCIDANACNFNDSANSDDGSCTYAEQGYDCDGNITEYIVGMEAEGGIVFYVDESGEHGLVAAVEDLGQFEWGCFGENVNGADGQAISTGYQNTMDIVNQGCETENGVITAAQAALDYESNGFDDWYLPSIEEVELMYNTISQGGSEGNIGGFQEFPYWSSSEINIFEARWVDFGNGLTFNVDAAKYSTYRVRVIRSF